MAASQGDALRHGISVKYVSLFVLIFQNSALVLIMRYSRILPGPRYLTSTAVLISEVLKCLVSAIVYLHQEYPAAKKSSLFLFPEDSKDIEATRSRLGQIADDVFGAKSGLLKMFIPAVLYTLQNNLQFIAASNLDAATFQVTYQCKILTTAIFAVAMLHQTLSIRKWISLLLLTVGIALVQLPSSSSTRGEGNWLLGMISVTVACVCSGLAGVYFEKTLKGNTSSLWLRNIQLSSASIVLAAAGALVWDWKAITDGGFFQGYNTVVVATIVTQAGGGLVVAVVIKYADNILKGFATSLSIIVSTIASVFLFDFIITKFFLFGSALVFLATYLYGLQDEPPKTSKSQFDDDVETALLSEKK